MKMVNVEDAVGMVLGHDMTEIIPGVKKGCAFKKGHIIQKEDIEKLLDIGKRHIYVVDLTQGYVHEDEAAKRIAAAVAGTGVECVGPSEGKINFIAACQGVIKIKQDQLYQLNMIQDVCVSMIHGNKITQKGKLLGGTRVIPLAIKEDHLRKLEQICALEGHLLRVLPLKKATLGVLVTGSEILQGRIKDQFGPVMKNKADEYDLSMMGPVFTGDDQERITEEIHQMRKNKADIICVCGGMSVDPDDRTPAAIRACQGEVITYGTPVLPGAMFMLSYVEETPVIGIPGCAMYAKRTILDLILPRLLAGERLSKQDFILLSYGGQCQGCEVCHFPDCGFGG